MNAREAQARARLGRADIRQTSMPKSALLTLHLYSVIRTVVIGIWFLGAPGPLAGCHRKRTCVRCAVRKPARFRRQSRRRHCAVKHSQSAAVAALIISPVRSISSARLRPIARLSAIIGVVQNSPIRTPGLEKEAFSAATARSQEATG
jgi:hypothetical protein